VAENTGEVTLLLRQLRAGDPGAADRLAPIVYQELRRVAGRAMRGERTGHTLQPTALVHEAYLRLAASPGVEWRNRAHFFGVAARLMREILVDHARKRSAVKRAAAGGATLADGFLLAESRIEEVVVWDEILDRLEHLDPRQGRIVELRFFAGLNVEEIAEVLGVSTPTVKREWASAKAWLHRELTQRQAR
jgi:RNA polymerase sigma factor (TIGR02999 family)